MSDTKSIEYVAKKSKELLTCQFEAYRNLDQKAGIVIGILSIFLPLFIGSITGSPLYIKVISLVPVMVLLIGMIIMLYVIRSNKLSQGYDETKFVELINIDIKNVYKEEIAYNKYSIEKNDKILTKKNKNFN